MNTPDTPAFRRLAAARVAYSKAFARALDAGAVAAAVQLERQAAQLNHYADFAELVYADAEQEPPR